MKNYKNEVQSIKIDLINDIKNLCAIPSLNDETTVEENQPFGKACRDALDHMLEIGKRDGFITHDQDGYAGHIDIGSGDEMIGILGHVDVVPADYEGFDSDPFVVVEKDNKLIGRGVADDKGPLLAAYYAAKMVVENNPNLNRKVRIIFGCNEELGSKCVEHYFKHQPYPLCGFTPDAGFPVVYGEKAGCFASIQGNVISTNILSIHAGERVNVVPDICFATLKGSMNQYNISFNTYLKEHKLEGEMFDKGEHVEISIKGKSAHGSTPHLGQNAIVLMCNYLNTIEEHKLVQFVCNYLNNYDASSMNLKHQGEMGEFTLSTGILHYEDNAFQMNIDMRAPHDMDFELLRTTYENLTNENNFKLDLDIGKYLYIDQQSTLIQTLHNAYLDVSNNTQDKPQSVGGGTYAKKMPNCVAFGPQFPGEDNHIHENNESIDIDSLLKATEIYALAIENLLKEEF